MGRQLKQALEEQNAACTYFAADGLQVGPCVGCGSCSGKTYGRCVQRDDMEKVLRALAASAAWVVLGPVCFGSYSYHIKKVLDRTATLGDPHYHVSRSELVKGAGHSAGRFYAVGLIADGCAPGQENAFRALHAENIRIMDCAGQCFVLPQRPLAQDIRRVTQVLAHA